MHRIMSGADDSVSGFLLRCITACAEPLYAGAAAARNWMYDAGVLSSHAAPLPVISVGNITTGGTGKTPMVIHLAQLLQQHGVKPAILMRGYGGDAGRPSDEYQLVLHALHDVPVIAAPDRVAAAGRLPKDHPECTAILLDDGFQHRRLKRDLDLVLVDASNPFGYGRVLPRGLLRESADGLRRAGGVIITHAEQVPPRDLDAVEQHIVRHHGRPPLAVFRHHWVKIVNHADEPVNTAAAQVIAACAIGNPEAFFAHARTLMHVTEARAMPDHHVYSAAEVEELVHEARQRRATAVLVTEKDWVKIKAVLKSPPAVPFWRPVLTIECLRGEKPLHQRLTQAVRSVME